MFPAVGGSQGLSICGLCTNLILATHMSCLCVLSVPISSLYMSLQTTSNPSWNEVEQKYIFLHLLVSIPLPSLTARWSALQAQNTLPSGKKVDNGDDPNL